MTEHAVGDTTVDAVLTASRALVAVATRSLGSAAEDTTIAQYRALVVVASRGPQRMVDLAGALDVTPSTAGRMCDRLARKDLVRRHRPGPTAGWSRFPSPPPAGRWWTRPPLGGGCYWPPSWPSSHPTSSWRWPLPWSRSPPSPANP